MAPTGYLPGMEHQDAISACAAALERGDPDRFLAAMAAPLAARAPLFVLGAFNLELARAPWATQEQLIARMRLQFWRDVVVNDAEPAHEVAAPLARLIAEAGLDRSLLNGMVDAREAEIGTTAPFTDTGALWAYLESGAGALMALSVQALGGPGASDAAIKLGAVQGMTNYLLAVPGLAAAGRQALPDDSADAIRTLANSGLVAHAQAWADLQTMPRPARPALLAAWRAPALLSQAAASPESVLNGALGQSEFARRGTLLWRSMTGRF